MMVRSLFTATANRPAISATSTNYAGEPAGCDDQVRTAYNVGTGTSVTIRGLVATIVDVTDSNSEITHTDGRDADIRHIEVDSTAIQTDLDYEPTVSLHEGLEQTVAWLREQ